MKEHFCPAEQSTITYQGECSWCGEKETLAQTQEPDDIASILACRDMLDAQPVPPRTEERNFCPRCGKRTADLATIHTCTPPQD